MSRCGTWNLWGGAGSQWGSAGGCARQKGADVSFPALPTARTAAGEFSFSTEKTIKTILKKHLCWSCQKLQGGTAGRMHAAPHQEQDLLTYCPQRHKGMAAMALSDKQAVHWQVMNSNQINRTVLCLVGREKRRTMGVKGLGNREES